MLFSHGYKIDKQKSTINWVKLTNGYDNLLVNAKKNTYHNTNNDQDKGDIIQFVSNRLNGNLVTIDNSKEAFYQAFIKLNEYLGISKTDEQKDLLNNKEKYFKKKETLNSIQDKEWNHKPIENFAFLTEKRSIDLNTLNHPIFKDRLYNTYFQLENGHLITNTAFAKLKSEEIVGLEVRNDTLKTITGDHDGIFITNTNDFNKIDYFFYSESAIDSISYFEILSKNPNFDTSKNNYCLASFGGNLYDSKIQTILEHLDRIGADSSTKFISNTDNDFDKPEEKKDGKKYDVMLTTALINKYSFPVKLTEENSIYYQLNFNKQNLCEEKYDKLKEAIVKQNNYVDNTLPKDQTFGMYFMIKENQNGDINLLFPKKLGLENNGFTHFISIIKPNLYIPHKSKGKDWNDDLQNIKKKIYTKNQSLNTVKPTEKKITNKTSRRSL